MASKYWIKLYHEILDDPKMGRLDDVLFRRAVECFLAAGDLGRKGALPTTADLAWRLRVDAVELENQMEALAEVGILTKDERGGWVVANFHKRQKPVSSAERMQRQRDRDRKAVQSRNDISDGTVTNRHTDIDEEAEADVEEKRREMEKESTSGSSQDDDLSKTFIAETGIPLHTGGEKKWKEALRRMRSAGVHTEDIREALHACYEKGLTIASLGSAVNPAIIEMSQRKARASPADDYRRFLKGPYGDVGVG